jgi:hypothetical protein
VRCNTADHFYESSALGDLLGVAVAKVNDNRLYRALDQLLPHKEELDQHPMKRRAELSELDYDLLLYDVIPTRLEGETKQNELAERGYLRSQTRR